ncbi:MAG: hypothetical protein HY937_03260 [Nitrosomonadales bacterium]|nr:hypothetical protein [Nitrosomonadales bacterium]
MTESLESKRKFNILVFGIERVGLPIPTEPISVRNFTIHFEKYETARRFNEYDGVIVFQGLFEKFKVVDSYMESYLSHTYDQDALDKRKKETTLLLGQGGFICFLLTDHFIDRNKGHDITSTDLAKYHLNYSRLYRENFTKRIAHVTPKQDEFKRFLELYGAASSHFTNHNDSLDFRVLAEVNGKPVGALINRAEYFLPSLVPDARPEVISEYYQLLVDALTSVHNKLHQEVPDWVASYKFDEEVPLNQERSVLITKITEIDSRLQKLSRFKAALVHTGPELVADVSRILEIGLGIKVDMTDQFREDLKLLGKDGKVVCVCEVKGINRGISREYINQTDSHRERSGYDNKFPALLIANTNIKNARSIHEKEQEIAQDQIKHAANMNVLVMRTFDLLGLLRLVLSGKLSREQAQEYMLANVGWLKVQADEVLILSGD